MSDERPEALLRSALEKIVYFEARSEQVQRDLETARAEGEALKRELAQAAQREIELRRELAEHQVAVARGHREREELSRVNEALRQERAALIGKLVESSRIHGAGHAPALDEPIDLASFISELRSEVLAKQGATAGPAANGKPLAAAPAPALGVSGHAARLQSEGRLAVTQTQLSELSASAGFPGRTEETLFGFSCRELSSPDATARVRAAERLRSLGTPAASPALATALHGEREPVVQVALLSALAALGTHEAARLVAPHLSSLDADVRIAALKATLALDPGEVAPHLTAALKDPDRAVRRRASLLALGLSGEVAQGVGEEAIRDEDAQVRTLAARALGAAGGPRARELLQGALKDRDVKVRQAAADSLSRILGQDVSAVVGLDDVQRRREVRRLASLPSRPMQLSPAQLPKMAAPAAPPAPEPERIAPEALCEKLSLELRIAIRGRTLADLCSLSGAPPDSVEQACELLVARGQAVRRAQKYFAA